ncbi:Hypothetical protein AJAP_01925 [Amycolatopsis japonica]|uniref:Uncharacterized protein n=1 Tax=Amycolatopsis japonica TaxID=208439 RepID=A0A075UT01_9PSEU|nr:hypothetical protein [Amycolatopsis japonica]AIG73315.1 Hypothetical protein AJAP_01925 [Amycolatopsis japonica]
MIEPISLAVGAGLFGAGLLTGKLTRRQTGAGTSPKPVCGCSHGLEQHDPDTKECHGQILHRDWIGNQWVPCTCRQYVGPKPFEELFVSPMLPPQDTA